MRPSTRSKVTAVVTIIGTEVPPSWGEDTIKILERELEMRFGKSAGVDYFSVSIEPAANTG